MIPRAGSNGSTRTDSGSPSAPSRFIRIRFDTFELDEPNARLMRNGQPVAVAPTPFAVLCELVRQPGELLTKRVLLDGIWGHQFVSESVLKTVISELRAALHDDARKPRYIETVSRRGYRFIAAATAIPISPPAKVVGVGSLQVPFFTGREDALLRLRSAWYLACTGKPGIVWVAGDPGVGKTALIEHFVSGLGDVTCARGQCVEQHGAGEPYLPILEALSELCRDDNAVAPLLRAVAPTWLLQLPWVCTAEEREALRRELVGVSPDRMLREMGEFFDRYTEQRPLLLVTANLHWSDRATIQLIDHIARRRSSGRLMWLASFRLAEVVARNHPLNALRHELHLHRLCEEIVLDPFSEREVGDYVADRAPAIMMDEAFIRALHERTDGLPLFVAHVMTDLVRDSALVECDAAARLAKITIPDNVTGIIDHYVDMLANEQRVLLESAAVCGIDFRVNTVAAVLERDATYVGRLCEELAREHLWLRTPAADQSSNAPDVPYSFRHALFRQVLYERIGPLARAQLHRKVGTALERERTTGLPITAANLATHFDRGGEPMAALRYYAEAAESALLHFSPREARSLAERALKILDQTPDGTGREVLEITLATLHGVSAAHLLGISARETKAAFQRAQALLGHVPQHPMRGLVAHGLGFVLCLRGEYAEALALAEKIEKLARATNDPVLLLGACTAQAEVRMFQGRPRIARECAERGLRAIESLGPISSEATFIADPRVMMLGQLAIQLVHLGLVEQARARLQQAHARAHELAQPMARVVAFWFDALFEVRLGNAERVAVLAEEMQAIIDTFALPEGLYACHWFRAWAQARTTDPYEGYRAIRDAYEKNTRVGMLAGGSEVLGYAAEALVLAGDWDGAQQQLDEALQIVNVLGERHYLPQLFLSEGAIARARGEPAAANSSIRRAIAEAHAQEAPWLELTALLALCEYDGASAEDFESLAAVIDQLPEAGGTAAVATARALLAKARAA